MKFKAEIVLLLVAIALFAASAFLYSSTTSTEMLTLASAPEFPYQGQAISLVGFGSLLMVTASISFLRRSKPAYLHVAKRVAKRDFSEELR